MTIRIRRYLGWMRVPSAVKRVTNPLVGRIPMRIRGGVNEGLQWSLASYGSGYGSGRRSAKQMEALSGLLRPGDVVWDLGAHHGYMTLCASRRVGETGVVHAFEPSPRSRWFLNLHVAWNRLRNVTIHSCALSSSDGVAHIGGGSTSKQHALGEVGDRVEVRSGKGMISAGTLPSPTFIKMDVEGQESEILRDLLCALGGETRLLIAIHSAQLRIDCLALLSASGYSVVESLQMQDFLSTGKWYGDADCFCYGPAYQRGPEDVATLARAGV